MDISVSKEFIKVYEQISELLEDIATVAKSQYDTPVVSYDEIINTPENLSEFNNDVNFVTGDEVDVKILAIEPVDLSNCLMKNEVLLLECVVPTTFTELHAVTQDNEDSSTYVATTAFVHNIVQLSGEEVTSYVTGACMNKDYCTKYNVQVMIDDSIGINNQEVIGNLIDDKIKAALMSLVLPRNVSDLVNDLGYITALDIPADAVLSVNGQTGIVQLDIPTVPTNISAFNNDVGYITDPGVISVNNRTGAVQVQENVQSDWNATTGLAKILNKPALKRVATSGDYNDLDNLPTIPVVPTNVSAFINDAGYLTLHLSLDNYATNAALTAAKLALNAAIAQKANINDLAQVAFSGDYTQLINTPTIPTTAAEVGAATLQLVEQKISELVDQAPATLDTLNELAEALGNDPNFATTIAAQIGAKYTKPADGIPYSDLSSTVQDSLDLADTALLSYTETDPTVPSWAKESSKPTYTASEVGALPSSTLYAGSTTVGGTANKTASIPFGKLDSTSTATVMTAQVEGISELRNGVCMFLMNGVVTSTTNFTININGLGAKPVYSTMAAASRATTLFNVNYTGFFVFNETRVEGGCWDFYYGYNSNDNTVGYNVVEYYSGTKRVKTASQRYQVMLTCFDGLLLPVFSGTYTTAATKTLTTEKFNPLGQIYYYNATTNLAANGAPANATLYPQAAYSLVDLRYSFNTASTLTAGEDIYLVCKPNIDGSAVLHSEPIAKALPTTEDGLLYKRLGKAYDTYRIILELDKPCYYYKNGAIHEWTGVDCLDSISQEETFTFAKADKTSNAEIEAVKGNTVVWNQMYSALQIGSIAGVETSYNSSTNTWTFNGTASTTAGLYISEAFGLTSGHKYLVKYPHKLISGTAPYGNSRNSIGYIRVMTSASAGSTILQYLTWADSSAFYTATDNYANVKIGVAYSTGKTSEYILSNVQIFDLTLMFGAGNEPSTVEEFETWLANNVGLKPYYAYNEGELISVKSTGIKTVGFNQWDEEWELGQFSNSTGLPLSANDCIRSKNFIPVFPNSQYYSTYGAGKMQVFFYREDGSFISHLWVSPNSFTTPDGCYKMKFRNASAYGTTYNHDICINLSNPSKNGTYEPYWSETKALPITTMTGKVNGEGSSVVIFPDGLKRAGSVYDEIYTDAQGVTRAIKRVGSVDLGTLTWVNANTNRHYVVDFSRKARGVNAVSAKYPTYPAASFSWTVGGGTSDLIGFQSTSDYLYIRTLATYADAAAFKAAMDGAYLYFELAEPQEYIVDDFTLPITVKMDEWGTKLMLPENTSTVTTLSPTLSVEYPSTESALEREIEGVNERISDLASLYTKPHHPLHENVRGFWDIVDYGDSAYTSRVEAFMPTNDAKWYDAYSSYSVHFNALSTDEYFNLYIDGDNNPILSQQLSSGDTTVNIANYPPNTYRYVVGDQEGTFTIAQERLFYNTDTQIRNVRDLGGMIGAQGCKIRYGLLIRGRAMESFSDYQMGWLNNQVFCRNNNMQYGVRLVYSLTFYGEISAELYDRKYAMTSSYSLISQIANGLENEDITQLKGVIKSIIVDAINKNNAVYFCCKLGTHRTGVVASILEGLLGCSASDIEKDFELSSGIEQTWSRTGNEVGQADAFRFIRENYNGSWYQWGVENLGLTLEEIEKFRYVMLEDYVPNISTYPIWKEDDVLYVERDNSIYPVSHPDLSTQPSILPQRFGVFDIKEVLVKIVQKPIEFDIGLSSTFCLNAPMFEYDGSISFGEPSGSYVSYLIFNSNNEMALTLQADGSSFYAYNPTKWYELREYNAGELGSNRTIYPLYSNYPYFKYFIATTNLGINKKYYYFDGANFQETTLESLYSEGYKDYVVELDPEIPSSATIISASSFNADACVPAICKKEDGKWTITNNEDIEPDFTLVQYYEASEGYYYVPQEQEGTIIATLRSDSAARTVPGLNVADVWGNMILPFPEGSIIGRVTIDGNTPSDLIVTEDGAAVVADFAAYQMVIPRPSGAAASINDALDLTVELYAL